MVAETTSPSDHRSRLRVAPQRPSRISAFPMELGAVPPRLEPRIVPVRPGGGALRAMRSHRTATSTSSQRWLAEYVPHPRSEIVLHGAGRVAEADAALLPLEVAPTPNSAESAPKLVGTASDLIAMALDLVETRPQFFQPTQVM